jgi:hypothetical protein
MSLTDNMSMEEIKWSSSFLDVARIRVWKLLNFVFGKQKIQEFADRSFLDLYFKDTDASSNHPVLSALVEISVLFTALLEQDNHQNQMMAKLCDGLHKLGKQTPLAKMVAEDFTRDVMRFLPTVDLCACCGKVATHGKKECPESSDHKVTLLTRKTEEQEQTIRDLQRALEEANKRNRQNQTPSVSPATRPDSAIAISQTTSRPMPQRVVQQSPAPMPIDLTLWEQSASSLGEIYRSAATKAGL